jgi:hypothetical protein
MNNPNLDIFNIPTRFTADKQPENRGRKKNRYKELQKKWQLGKRDLEALLGNLILLNFEELKAIAENPDEDIIQIAFARALMNDLKNGTLEKTNVILDRIFGRSVERVVTEDKTDFTKQIKTLAEIRQKVVAQKKTPLTGTDVTNNNQ